MKRNNALTPLFICITAILITSCSGIRYTYFDKQKVPYTAPEETKLAKTIPAKPFLKQEENELRKKISTVQNKKAEQKNTTASDAQKKQDSSNLQQTINNLNIAKYISNGNKGIQSEKHTADDERTLIVILVVLVLVLIALVGDVIGLLIFALILLLIFFLLKYLGVFS